MSGGEIIFVGNARCYHTMDWYRSAQRVCAPRTLRFATDLIESEGHARLVTDADAIIPLFNVDRLLWPSQSRLGNVWRNAIKFLLLPLQVSRLKAVHRDHPSAVYHAHTMYYMLACALAGVPFVGTPQGSEVLVRPRRSRVYHRFATRALKEARGVTVDSQAMADGVQRLSGRSADIVQNGIDIGAIDDVMQSIGPAERRGVLSVRAIDPNYRISEIFTARDASRERPAITLLHPFVEQEYATGVVARLQPGDRDLGRLPRATMYGEMARALLVVSVPISDSSPRSVYEAVFCGAAVAVSSNAYVDALPACMRARIRVVDVTTDGWLDDALAWARQCTASAYVPSAEALEQFDQRRSMQRIADRYY